MALKRASRILNLAYRFIRLARMQGAPGQMNRNNADGIEALAEACRPLLDHTAGWAGYRYIDGKFNSQDGVGPTSVRKFVEESQSLGDRLPDQCLVDAFGPVDAWPRALCLRA
jgi:hypothetical protein